MATQRILLTPQRVYEAGEAVIKLRLKLEIEDAAVAGMNRLSAAKKAGESGGKASQSARQSRIEALIDKMSFLAEDSPNLIAFMTDEQLADAAMKAASDEDPDLWRQGKGQTQEYLGEIRRGDAGTEMQTRYRKIFPEIPPMRLPRKHKTA